MAEERLKCEKCGGPIAPYGPCSVTSGGKFARCYKEHLEQMNSWIQESKLQRHSYVNYYDKRRQETKAMIISLRGYSCELCHANDVPLQIHHKHYRRPTGLERPEDLLLLCQNCHRLRHVIRARAIEQERKFHFARKAN